MNRKRSLLFLGEVDRSGRLLEMKVEVEAMKKKMVSQDKMKLVGTIGSILSVCMYVSYIPQILGNLSGHPGDWIQPLVAFINCTIWVTYGFFKQQRDWPIVIANFPGIVFGLTTALTALL